jgi:hypothetical protein
VSFRLGRHCKQWNELLEYLWELNGGEGSECGCIASVEVDLLSDECLMDLLCNHLVGGNSPLMQTFVDAFALHCCQQVHACTQTLPCSLLAVVRFLQGSWQLCDQVAVQWTLV